VTRKLFSWRVKTAFLPTYWREKMWKHRLHLLTIISDTRFS